MSKLLVKKLIKLNYHFAKRSIKKEHTRDWRNFFKLVFINDNQQVINEYAKNLSKEDLKEVNQYIKKLSIKIDEL